MLVMNIIHEKQNAKKKFWNYIQKYETESNKIIEMSEKIKSNEQYIHSLKKELKHLKSEENKINFINEHKTFQDSVGRVFSDVDINDVTEQYKEMENKIRRIEICNNEIKTQIQNFNPNDCIPSNELVELKKRLTKLQSSQKNSDLNEMKLDIKEAKRKLRHKNNELLEEKEIFNSLMNKISEIKDNTNNSKDVLKELQRQNDELTNKRIEIIKGKSE